MVLRTLAFLALTAGLAAADEPARHRPAPAVPVPAAKLDAALGRGVAHLVKSQNKDGSWGKPSLEGGVEITAGIGSHHAFTVAVTSLSVAALIEAGGDATDVRQAIDKGV